MDKVRDAGRCGDSTAPTAGHTTTPQPGPQTSGLPETPGSQLPVTFHILPVVPTASEDQRVFCITLVLPEVHPAETKLGCPLRAQTEIPDTIASHLQDSRLVSPIPLLFILLKSSLPLSRESLRPYCLHLFLPKMLLFAFSYNPW